MTLEKVRRMELEQTQEKHNQALAVKTKEEPRTGTRKKGVRPLPIHLERHPFG
jgi:hypothetical protein